MNHRAAMSLKHDEGWTANAAAWDDLMPPRASRGDWRTLRPNTDGMFELRLLQAGVHVDFHLTPGAPHGYAGNAVERRADAIRSI
jgi:acetyl esterase/lipase